MRNRIAAVSSAVIVALGALAVPAAASPGQTVEDLTSDALSIEALAASLIGDDTVISNATFTGDLTQGGRFSGMGALGVESGVVLSTGKARDSLPGPNAVGNQTYEHGLPGDEDLSALIDDTPTYDAAVLEFDFVAKTSEVSFSYVFGSEEYNEFVNSEYNDVFGFFVNGTNYAQIATANGAVPVSVNNVNKEVNAQHFVDNTSGTHDTEVDGFTKILTFKAPVNVGQVNHIKLAIADTSDDLYDSIVAIQAGTFKANTPPSAENRAVTTTVDTPVTIKLIGSDPEGDPLSFEILGPPPAEEGELSEIDGNLVTFTPAPGFIGTSTFTYRSHDGAVFSDPATVTVTVSKEAVVPPAPDPTPTATPTSQPTPEPTAEPTADPTTPAPTTPAPTTPPVAPSPTVPAKPQLPITGVSGVGALIGATALATAAGVTLVRRRSA